MVDPLIRNALDRVTHIRLDLLEATESEQLQFSLAYSDHMSPHPLYLMYNMPANSSVMSYNDHYGHNGDFFNQLLQRT